MPLRRAFGEHDVETAFERGWSELENGALLQAAEATGFDVYIRTDKNLRYQQNLSGRRISILVLWTTSWPEIAPHGDMIAAAALLLHAGELRELDRP